MTEQEFDICVMELIYKEQTFDGRIPNEGVEKARVWQFVFKFYYEYFKPKYIKDWKTYNLNKIKNTSS